uniref:Uncharacterized protein n=1 Tax=Solanum lycopersicum TaxID=4081 RepID=A0A3Q7G5Y3_SOLLC
MAANSSENRIIQLLLLDFSFLRTRGIIIIQKREHSK